MALVPIWGDKLTAPWGTGPRLFRNDNLPDVHFFAHYLADRLKDRSNVVWILGGDRPAKLKGILQAAIIVTEGAIVTNSLLPKYIQEAVGKTADARIQWVQATHYPGNGCDSHPTKAQHLRMADNIEPVLRKALSW